VPLPLDAGEAEPAIPAHLRRAAAARHPHCAFPGCDQPSSVCQIHHLIPRSAGGPTALHNLVPLCAFHHLIVIHRWGWTLRLKPDGATTATSPDGRTLHSYGPPTPRRSPPGQQDSPPSQAA
jgi:HNH endonuclease